MTHFQVSAVATAIAVVLIGCSRYEAGNLDRERCETLRPGLAYEQIVSVMGQPQRVLTLAGQKRQILVYNTPAMTELPMFSADKSVEIVVAPGVSGLLLQEALCTGAD